MGYVKAFFMALGMFTIIPTLKGSWDDRSADRVLAVLPAVGLVVGVMWLGLAGAMAAIGIGGGMVGSALLALFPLAITGGIHMDGFIDTCDAVMSRRERDEKIRILKDPHMGAFGALSLMSALLLQTAAIHDISAGGAPLAMLIVIPVITRATAALFMYGVDPMESSSYGKYFRGDKRGGRSRVSAITMAAALLCGYILGGPVGFAVAALSSSAAALSMKLTSRDLGGMSGDLSGHGIVIGEMAGLMAMALILQ